MRTEDEVANTFTRNFGGLDVGQCRWDDARFVVLCAPYEATTSYVRGTSVGPSAIVDASMNMELYDEEVGLSPCDSGICTLAPFVHNELKSDPVGPLREAAIEHMKAGKFLVSLGGEHTITLGLVEGARETHGDITVVQFDAHADLRDEYEERTISHATVMRRVNERSPVVQVGVRSLCREEAELVDKGTVTTIMAHEMFDGSDWRERLFSAIEGNVYITFDVDVLDPSVINDTGTPEPGGLTWYPTLEILHEIFRRANVVGIDFVELCPIHANVASAFAVAKLAYRCMAYRLEKDRG